MNLSLDLVINNWPDSISIIKYPIKTICGDELVVVSRQSRHGILNSASDIFNYYLTHPLAFAKYFIKPKGSTGLKPNSDHIVEIRGIMVGDRERSK